jgi:hypothetical protein
MIRKFVSSKVIVTDVYDLLNIGSDDFVGRVPGWINKALFHLRCQKMLVDAEPIDTTYTDYKILIPTDLYTLDKIIVNDYVLSEVKPTTRLDFTKDYGYKYFYEDNGYYYFEQETNTIKIYYKKIPVVFDKTTQSNFPLIPDDEIVKENLTWFVVSRILSRGYKHPIYALGSKDPEYDPNKKWQQTRMMAKASLSRLSAEDRKNMSNILVSFLDDKSNYNEDDIKNIRSSEPILIRPYVSLNQ